MQADVKQLVKCYRNIRSCIWSWGPCKSDSAHGQHNSHGPGWLVGWSLTSLFSTNTAISETKKWSGILRSCISASSYDLGAVRLRSHI